MTSILVIINMPYNDKCTEKRLKTDRIIKQASQTLLKLIMSLRLHLVVKWLKH